MRRNGKINHAVEVLFDNRSVGARQRGLSAIRADLSNLRVWTDLEFGPTFFLSMHVIRYLIIAVGAFSSRFFRTEERRSTEIQIAPRIKVSIVLNA